MTTPPLKTHLVIRSVTPTSWAWLAAAQLVALGSVMPTSLLGVLSFWGLFWIFNIAALAADKFLFSFLNPESKALSLGLTAPSITAMNTEASLQLLSQIVEYPRRRAWYFSVLLIVSGGLAAALTSLYWGETQFPPAFLWSALSIVLLSSISIFQICQAETHLSATQLISEIHQISSWEKAFERFEYPERSPTNYWPAPWDFIVYCAAALLFLVASANNSSQVQLESRIWSFTLNVAGIVAFRLRTLYLLDRLFVISLQRFIEAISSPERLKSSAGLALHSTPVMGRLDKAFNNLFGRLKQTERELAHWVYQEVDKSRFRMLGEISGLVAHDLMGPLHVVRFCVEELQEDPKKAMDPQFMAHLSSNITRPIELLDSLRARLKNPSIETSTWTPFLDAHNHVTKLLGTQFHSKGFSRIQFHLDPRLDQIRVRIPRMDLTQILDNLYRNCVDNLLQNQIASPEIRISLTDKAAPADDKTTTILISDNGTGLTRSRFQNLTQYSFLSHSRDHGKSLGLKLTCRLVELNGGELNVVTTSKSEGTVFELKMILQEAKRS